MLNAKITIKVFTGFLFVALTACGGNSTKNLLGDLPDWVFSPSIENGMAASSCVPWSGNLSIDRDQATAEARNEMTRQIELKATSFNKTYGSKTTVAGGTNVGATFEKNARQFAQASIRGSKRVKGGLFAIENQKQFCVMVAINPEQSEAIFKQLVKTSGAQLNSNDERVLSEQFKAWKGQQELERLMKE